MVVMAACVLHNYLIKPKNRDMVEGQRDGEHGLQSVRHMGGNRGPREALQTREFLCNFFDSPEGALNSAHNV